MCHPCSNACPHRTICKIPRFLAHQWDNQRMAGDSQSDATSPASTVRSHQAGTRALFGDLDASQPPHIPDRAKMRVVPGGHAEGRVHLQLPGLRCWLSLLLSVFGLSHKKVRDPSGP